MVRCCGSITFPCDPARKRWYTETSPSEETRNLPIPASWRHMNARREARKRRRSLERIGLASSGSPLSGEATLCIAYFCPWAHACASAPPRPALVGARRCTRRYPETVRPVAGLSDHSLDLLAAHRERGHRLAASTLGMLDELRPSGPSRSLQQKRPMRPVYEGPGVRFRTARRDFIRRGGQGIH